LNTAALMSEDIQPLGEMFCPTTQTWRKAQIIRSFTCTKDKLVTLLVPCCQHHCRGDKFLLSPDMWREGDTVP